MLRVPESLPDDDAKRPTVGPESAVADRQECERREQPCMEPSDIAQKRGTVPVTPVIRPRYPWKPRTIEIEKSMVVSSDAQHAGDPL